MMTSIRANVLLATDTTSAKTTRLGAERLISINQIKIIINNNNNKLTS